MLAKIQKLKFLNKKKKNFLKPICIFFSSFIYISLLKIAVVLSHSLKKKVHFLGICNKHHNNDKKIKLIEKCSMLYK